MSAALETEINAEASAEPDIEVRARTMGWKPKEEYRGAPEQWRDARTFVERGENELPILKERYRSVEKELAAVRRAQDQSLAVITDLTERVRTTDVRAFERARADLLARREQAVEAADKDGFKAAERELEALDKTAPKPVPQAPAAPAPAEPIHPDVAAWAQTNDWYFRDPVLAAEAQRLHVNLRQTNPELSVTENLKRVTSAVRAAFPERFPAPKPRAPEIDVETEDEGGRRRQPPAVLPSSPAPGARRNPRSFDAMPQDSKDSFRRYAEQLAGKGKPLTKEEWAQIYWDQFE